jgi:hypothetical protein
MNHDQNFKNLILDYLRPSLDFFAKPEATGTGADQRPASLFAIQLSGMRSGTVAGG